MSKVEKGVYNILTIFIFIFIGWIDGLMDLRIDGILIQSAKRSFSMIQ